MDKPYIKKHSEIEEYAAWIVDGKYIRENIDSEFTNFSQHWESKYIPKNEFWIDKEMAEGEIEFYIKHLLVEIKLMADGMNRKKTSRKDAREIANYIEKRERMESEKIKKAVGKDNEITEKEAVSKVKKELLETYSGKMVSVWIVDGELARSLFFLNFTEGGHNFVYNFIPENEVWIDDDISPLERKFILLHELYERYLMAVKKWTSYDKAHARASRLEYFYRKHPENLDINLKYCVKLNNGG